MCQSNSQKHVCLLICYVVVGQWLALAVALCSSTRLVLGRQTASFQKATSKKTTSEQIALSLSILLSGNEASSDDDVLDLMAPDRGSSHSSLFFQGGYFHFVSGSFVVLVDGILSAIGQEMICPESIRAVETLVEVALIEDGFDDESTTSESDPARLLASGPPPKSKAELSATAGPIAPPVPPPPTLSDLDESWGT